MLQEETLARKFVKKWFWLYIFTFLIAPLWYVIKMTLSRDLTVEEVGMIYGVISFVTLLWIYNDLGFTESLNFFLPKHIVNKDFGKAKHLLKITFLLQIVSSITIASLLYFWAPWLAENYFHTDRVTSILQIAWLYFIGINIIHISTVLFTVSQDVKLQKLTEFTRMGVTAVWTLILFFADSGNLNSYMWIWIGWIVAGMIFSFSFSYYRYYKPYFKNESSVLDKQERKEFIKYAGATLLTSNIGNVLSQIDMQLIIFLLGSAATGFYSNYLSLMNIPFMFISPILAFLFPVISELHGRSDNKSMTLIHERFSLYLSIIGIWVGFFLLQFWESLAVVFFGEAFRTSWYVLMFSAPFLIFNLLTQVNFQLLAWTGKVGSRMKILAITIPINLVLNLIFIHLFEVSWAALAVGLSWIPLWFMSHLATKKHHGQFRFPTLLKNMSLAAVSYGLLFFIIPHINPSLILILGIAVLVNLIIFSVGNKHLLQEAFDTIKRNRY